MLVSGKVNDRKNMHSFITQLHLHDHLHYQSRNHPVTLDKCSVCLFYKFMDTFFTIFYSFCMFRIKLIVQLDNKQFGVCIS